MYQIHIGDPYKTFKNDDTICVTTNGIVKEGGKAVMGKGTALFAREVFGVDTKLGDYLKQHGNRSFFLGEYTFPSEEEFQAIYKKTRDKRFFIPSDFKNSFGKTLKLATFPTKYDWRDKSDLNLIEQSAKQIVSIADKFKLEKIYIPLPGGLNGGLHWQAVKSRLNCLDERFIIYSRSENDFK